MVLPAQTGSEYILLGWAWECLYVVAVKVYIYIHRSKVCSQIRRGTTCKNVCNQKYQTWNRTPKIMPTRALACDVNAWTCWWWKLIYISIEARDRVARYGVEQLAKQLQSVWRNQESNSCGIASKEGLSRHTTGLSVRILIHWKGESFYIYPSKQGM